MIFMGPDTTGPFFAPAVLFFLAIYISFLFFIPLFVNLSVQTNFFAE